eukprot:1084545-Rhodomonas_salina.1
MPAPLLFYACPMACPVVTCALPLQAGLASGVRSGYAPLLPSARSFRSSPPFPSLPRSFPPRTVESVDFPGAVLSSEEVAAECAFFQ